MSCGKRHRDSSSPGRSLTYGELAERAARLPVPRKVKLKDPQQFKLIGKPVKRLDTPGKVDGSAQFGIDVRLPGMKIATVAACPVFGGRLAAVDDAKAKGLRGVRQVVRLEDAVAVIADDMWAAQQGLAALEIRWDEGANATLTTAEVVRHLAAASEGSVATARKEGNAGGMRSRLRPACQPGHHRRPDGRRDRVRSSAALWGEVTLVDGRVQQQQLTDYRVMRMNEMPAIGVHIVPSTQSPGGVGEPGTSVAIPALTNAVFAATGRRIRKLPIGDELKA